MLYAAPLRVGGGTRAVAPRLGIVSPPRQSQFSLRAQHAHPGHEVVLLSAHNCHTCYEATLIDQLIYEFIHLLSYSSVPE